MWLLALAAVVCVALSCENEPTTPPVEEHYCAWMPTDAGNWWEYQVTEEARYSPPEIYKLKLEIYEVRNNYRNTGRPAYFISVSKDGKPQFDLIASALDDACYLERYGLPAYLMQDSITKGTWTQTGLVVDFPLQYRSDQRRTVPAGRFDCREMFYENASVYKPETWNEYYAERIGLIAYYYTYKEYDTSVPPQLLDWRSVSYELLISNINHQF
jgi:hypothetical protein